MRLLKTLLNYGIYLNGSAYDENEKIGLGKCVRNVFENTRLAEEFRGFFI